MKKFFICLAFIIIGILFLITPAFADNTAQQDDSNCVSTSIIQNADGKFCDDGGGGGVWAILNIGLTVLTFGIGIAATAGLIICGIQYATSGTNEAQATKARRRIFEIVIGLIAYAVLYLALNWLIPGLFTTDVSMTPANSSHKTTQSSTPNTPNIASTKKTTNKTSKNTAKAAEARRTAKFQNTIKRYTYPTFKNNRFTWKNGSKNEQANTRSGKLYGINVGWRSQGEADCGAYVGAMMKLTGWDKSMKTTNVETELQYLISSNKWKEIPRSKIMKDINAGGNGNSLLKPGDIIVEKDSKPHHHIILYVGKIPGFSSKFTEASYGHFTGSAARPTHSSMKAIYNDYKNAPNHRVWVFRKVF